MTKSLIGCLAAISLLLPFTGRAQMPDTSEVQGLIQYTLQPVDKSQVPTGYLEEWGVPALSPANFNGLPSAGNVVEPNLWRMLYHQVHTAWCGAGANPLPHITAVNAALEPAAGQPVPIAVLLGSYNAFRPDAISTGLMDYNGSTRQFYDVPGRTQSPYETKRLFAATPVNQYCLNATETFVYGPGTTWNNTGLTINQLQVDFANGEGFRTLQPNTPLTVNFPDTGFYKLTLRATLSDATTAECDAEYFVLTKPDFGARYQPANVVVPAWGVIPAQPGVHAGGTIQIIYSSKSFSGTLRKPLVVVENLDAFSLTPSLQSSPYDVTSFLNDIINAARDGYDFNQELDFTAGYDLVFINFNNGLDAIENNAAVVEEALVRINNNKVTDNRSGQREQNVVLGMGTGGLNARYALARYTKANPTISNPTETRLLITHDSPHRGSNIALGLQHLSYMIANYDWYGTTGASLFPEFAQSQTFLSSPVMQQTLLYRATSDVSNTANTWLDAVYRPMVDYPNAPYRFVATSLGNECAHPLYAAGKKFMDWSGSQSAGVKAKLGVSGIDIISVPLINVVESKYHAAVYASSIPEQNSFYRRVAGLVTTYKFSIIGITVYKRGYDKMALAPVSYLPVDGVPGSIQPMADYKRLKDHQEGIPNLEVGYQYLVGEVPLIKPFKLKLYSFWKFKTTNSGEFTTLFSALPVGSALDVSPFDAVTFTQLYANGINTQRPSKGDPFIAQESVTAQGLYNNASMRFTARNARFMFKEMEQQPNTEYCSAECGVAGLAIQGPGLICTQETFSIQGMPASGSATWSVTPSSGVVSLAPVGNGSSVVVTRTGNGRFTLQTTLACGQTATRSLRAGVYSTSDYNLTQWPTPVCANGTFQVGMPWYYYPPAPGTTYDWYWSGGVSYVSGQGTSVVTLKMTHGSVSRWVMGRANNACGTGPFQTVNISVNPYCVGYRVSPNPADGIVSIEPVSESGEKALPNEAGDIQEVQVIDKIGAVKMVRRFGKGIKVAQLDVSRLPNDVYTLKIIGPGSSYNTKVLVLRQ